MAENVAAFPRINNTIGVGQLYLPVGTTNVFIWAVGELHYLGWWYSTQNNYKGLVLSFGKSEHAVSFFFFKYTDTGNMVCSTVID